jgi:hypothetical protein
MASAATAALAAARELQRPAFCGQDQRALALWMPPTWKVIYQQALRWLAADCFEALVHDLRELLRLPAPTLQAQGFH